MSAPPNAHAARSKRPQPTFDAMHRDPSEDSSQYPWKLRCPECGAAAFSMGTDLLCSAEARRVTGRDGVLTLIRAERQVALAPFLEAYRSVRRSEDWGGDVAYYRELPFASGGRHRAVWKLRARSYRAALRAIERHYPDAKHADERGKVALRMLELGAGNAWFSWRMAQRGHYALATDISLDDEDGLGALARYAWPKTALPSRLTAARAELEELPLEDSQFDVVVANGALHYALNVARAVEESRRVLRTGGIFLVLDSPVYDAHETGRAMVRRREKDHRERLGVLPTESTTGYLVASEFCSELESAGFHVETCQPFEGLRRRLRRSYCALRRLAPPARFPLFVAEKRA